MPIFEIELSDGRKFEVEADAPPSEQDVMAALGGDSQPPADDSPSVMSERTWTDRAIEALPTIGGMAGGLIGGKLPIVGSALAGVGGAAGEAFKQTANAVRGRMDLVPGSVGEQLKAIGTQGAVQAGAEGGGRLISKGLQAVAAPIYNFGLGASKALRREYPNLAKTGLDEGISVSSRGTAKAGRLLTQSAKQADDVIGAAEKAGAPAVRAKDVVTGGGFREVSQEARKRAQLGMADETPEIIGRAKTLQAKNPQGIPISKAQGLKRTAQDAADKAFRAEERGGQAAGIGAELDMATARGLRKSIADRVPAVGPINERSQALGGLKTALDDAETRNHILSRLIVPTAAGVSAGFGSGDVSTGLGSAATTAALTAPGNLSRVAIGMFGAGKHNVPAHLIRAAILAQLEGE